jgi:hypothetical protein
MPNLFAKQRIIARPGYNRWMIPPASIAIHLCIGSVYAWSNFNPPLMKVQGVVASSAEDWSLPEVAMTLSNASLAAYLPGSFANDQNSLPADTFDWTKRVRSPSSMPSFRLSETNHLRR